MAAPEVRTGVREKGAVLREKRGAALLDKGSGPPPLTLRHRIKARPLRSAPLAFVISSLAKSLTPRRKTETLRNNDISDIAMDIDMKIGY